MIEIRALNKAFSHFQLSIDHLTLHPGITLVAGKNGAGKSTLLHILATVLEPDRGHVVYANDPDCPLPLIRSEIGFLPTGIELYQNMTVSRLLTYLAELKGKGLDQASRHSYTKELLQLFSLESVQDHKLKYLSQGYQQRVAIAQSLIGWPHFLFLDEPLTFLDSIEKRRVISVLRRHYHRRRMAVVVTHDLDEWEGCCDYVLWIDEGRVRFYGTSEQWKFSSSLYAWEGKIKADDLKRLPHTHIIRSKPSENGLFIRVIASRNPFPSFQPVKPTLEDAYFLRKLNLQQERHSP
ncbi:ABC-type multidrug transport system ATPase subunit [Caldalkalibacillus uzonensis]|uniref:ABC-type multidrug transport system ATPase subunit n=1 Tax=Caldalkalibacillus uzonensis TaxID=353224 RepID=A0ABU0CU17_9BACI|nr:ABC transporter ATP-binding protein [Caldalkalibacillus uzonensis]MDQ0339839.1 ABC-type multidrug transport system ATPase subunit [Caldalkalibacillus uzonensis]